MVLTIDFELDTDDEELLEELGYGSDASGSSLSISDFPFLTSAPSSSEVDCARYRHTEPDQCRQESAPLAASN